MKDVRKKMRMNSFVHSEFDPDLSYSSLAPILDRVLKARNCEYDENTEKGRQYIMDYILESIPENEIKKLCNEVETTKYLFIKLPSTGTILKYTKSQNILNPNKDTCLKTCQSMKK